VAVTLSLPQGSSSNAFFFMQVQFFGQGIGLIDLNKKGTT